MECSRLASDLKFIEINGVTINLEERSCLDLACTQLAADINQDCIYFWGKIRGKYLLLTTKAKLAESSSWQGVTISS